MAEQKQSWQCWHSCIAGRLWKTLLDLSSAVCCHVYKQETAEVLTVTRFSASHTILLWILHDLSDSKRKWRWCDNEHYFARNWNRSRSVELCRRDRMKIAGRDPCLFFKPLNSLQMFFSAFEHNFTVSFSRGDYTWIYLVLFWWEFQ